jgi:hypothetical protein
VGDGSVIKCEGWNKEVIDKMLLITNKSRAGFASIGAVVALVVLGVVILGGIVLQQSKSSLPQEPSASLMPLPTAKQAEPSEKRPVIGGPCKYDFYQGRCTIISIKETEESRKQEKDAGYKGLEVKYQFEADDEIPEQWRDSVSEERSLRLDNSWYPGPLFIEKSRLEVDKVLPCGVELITEGTCTPVHFQFPTINTADYFESGI